MTRDRRKRIRLPAHRTACPECEEFSFLLAEYWEGETDSGLRAEIEGHIEICPQCRQVFASYSRTVRACRSADRINEPGEAHRRLWEELARQMRVFRDYLDR